MGKLLTIGITSFNNPSFLEDLLDSLDNECWSYPEFYKAVDIILYDDASTEKILDIEKYGFLSVHYASKNSGGPSKGRNFIIEEAKSKYICFIDGDDIFRGSFKELIPELSSKDADLLVSDVVKVHHDGIETASPFIFSKILFSKSISEKEIQKLSVHQTGIWSIYKVDFLKNNGLKYREDIRYEDNYFLASLMLKSPKIQVLQSKYYGWRVNRNSFTNQQNVLEHRILVYKEIIELIKKEGQYNFGIQALIFYSIWNQTMINIIRNYPNVTKKEFKLFYKEIKKINNLNSKYIRKLFMSLDYNYVDVFTKYLFRYSIFQKWTVVSGMNNLMRMRTNFRTRLYSIFLIFQKIPLNNKKHFFTSHYGDFCDNSKYLYLEMKKSSKYKNDSFIFATHKYKELNKYYNVRDFIPYRNKLLFFYHHYTAKYIYLISWYSPNIKKRKKQVWEQLWHGIPYKKVFTDINSYERTVSIENHQKKMEAIKYWDIIHSVNKYNTEIFQKLFSSAKIHEEEYPKVRWLIDNKNNITLIDSIKKEYCMDTELEYILYAPTYRPYKIIIDVSKIVAMIEKCQKLVIHMHPLMKVELLGTEEESERIIFLSKIEDIQEIILATEGVITDYSSIMYDYQQLGKKVITYQPDFLRYSRIHGLYENGISTKGVSSIE